MYEIKQEMGKSYLVVPCNTIVIENYKLRMITENKIEGLLTCKKSYDNGETLYFDITNKISLYNRFCKTSIDFEDIKQIFSQISRIYETGEEYLLGEDGYILDPQYIFFDIEDNLNLLYLPGINENVKNKTDSFEGIYYGLADLLIQRVNNKDDKGVRIAYQFYRISKEPTFSIRLFIEYILKEEKISSVPEITNSVTDTEYIDDSDSYGEDEEQEDILWWPVWVFAAGSVINPVVYFYTKSFWLYASYLLILEGIFVVFLIFRVIKNIFLILDRRNTEEDLIVKPVSIAEYWDDNEETQYFDENTTYFDKEVNLSDICLEWKEKGIKKKYRMTKYPVIIGKLTNEVDCRIDDSSISRLHLKIMEKNGVLSILDLNSTNGTMVDGEKIRPGEEVNINMSSEIMLGQVIVHLV